MAWFYGHALGYTKKEKSFGLDVGTDVHMLAELYYTNLRQVPHDELIQIIVDEVKRWLAECDGSSTVIQEISRASTTFHRYIKEWAQKEDLGHQILGTEHFFDVPFTTGAGRNYRIRGYIDVLSQKKFKIFAWDHKTFSSGGFWTPTQLAMDIQLPIYMMCLREEGTFQVDSMLVNQLNTYPYKNLKEVDVGKLFKRQRSYRTPLELDNLRRELGMMVDDLVENGSTPRRSLNKGCDRCQFNEPCLMQMKGHDPEPFFINKFKKKVDRNPTRNELVYS